MSQSEIEPPTYQPDKSKVGHSDHSDHSDHSEHDKNLQQPDEALHVQHSQPYTITATPKQVKRYAMAFAVTTFGIGPAFGSAVSYMTYQMQLIGYAIGHNPGMPNGSGCFDFELPCRVPFGASDLNLTSVFLYLNAIAYGVSGALVLLVCGLGDHFPYKREQYIGGTILYGALCLPAAGLTAYKLANFNALAVLYSTFNVVGFLVQAWMNIFVPYVMHQAAPIDNLSPRAKADAMEKLEDLEIKNMRAVREKQGLRMSVWGSNSMNTGTIIFYLITIGISYASADAALHAGLYMATCAGGICIITALLGWRFLPRPGGRAFAEGVNVWYIPILTFANLFRGIYRYPQAFKFLIAYTIYNDSVFAFGIVIGNLFNLTVRPSLVEYTCYSICGAATSIIGATAFLYIFPRTGLSFRQWAIGCYLLVALVAVWCLLGLNDGVPIGFKHRAEFYVATVLQNLAGSILSPLFRVLFSELFPKGSEVQYFGFQLVLSCSTVWIPQVVDGPIVNATNNQRLPAIIALVFFLSSAFLVFWCDDVKGIATVRQEEIEKLREGPQ